MTASNSRRILIGADSLGTTDLDEGTRSVTDANCAEVICRSLVGAGVTTMFGYPGDPTIELMEQARRHGIDVVLARREGTAAFMAEGQAALTGALGVTFSTLGPGSTALVNGVAAAQLDRIPLLAISGQIESGLEQFFTHQVVDHKLLFSPITKWAGRIETKSVGTVMRKALRTATAERPGAVHLTCPNDVLTATAIDSEVTAVPLGRERSATIAVYRGTGNPGPLEQLAAAHRPVVLAGVGATRGEATSALVTFAEAVGAPVVVAPMAKGVFPETHPCFAGIMDVACNKVVKEFIDGADLIVAVGFDVVELVKPWTYAAPVLHIDSVPNTDQVYAAGCEIVGDIAAILEWLSGEWSGQQRWSEPNLAAHRSHLREVYLSGQVAGRLNPSEVVEIVQGAMPSDTVVTTDVGSHKFLVAQGWVATRPRSVLMSNGLSAMGFGLPAAIAAAMTLGGRPVAALIGDGGFAMTATELRLAARLGLPLVCVVFADGSLNRIELKQMVAGYPSTATRLEEMDLIALAEGLACDGVRVSSTTELEMALAGAGSLSRPLIVEARIDPAQYLAQF
jgi:acetolactate synthase-1/2/3 large subunit